MPTSGSCRRSADPLTAAGFSLLELLVVLAIVSIMVALVAPRLAGTVRAIQVSGDRIEVARQIERLPLLARASGEPINIAVGADVAVDGIEFPKGWKVTALSAVDVHANGFCRPAQLRVDNGDGSETWSLATPDCTVDHGP